ncbi:MAG: DoxX family membrane protein [Flavobacteriales bacterium]|nr:MAG: DoxX family membrane protein [Flavobacteriales bacterium]
MNSHIKSTSISIIAISCLLILLWVYTAMSKLTGFAKFEQEMAAQNFGPSSTEILVWTIPTVELIAAFALLFGKTRLYGFVLSFVLLLLFTGYIALVLLGSFEKIPCSCGGVLQQLGWQAHFWFNVFFLLLSAMGIIIQRKQHISQTHIRYNKI